MFKNWSRNMKRPIQTRFSGLLMLMVLCIIGLQSCYERIDGCTEFNAINFNVQADDNCCCQYPLFNFQLQHRFGADSVRFVLDSVYGLDNGIAFKLTQFEMLGNSFFLDEEDGGQIEVEDEIDFEGDRGSNCPCKDDVFIINPASFSTSPGSIAKPGPYEAFGFSSGLRSEFDGLQPPDFPASHPLNSASRFDTLDGQFYQLRATFVFPEINDTLFVNTTQFEMDFFFENPIEIPRGENSTHLLRINYKNWLEGLDFLPIPQSQLETILFNNAKDAIEFIPE